MSQQRRRVLPGIGSEQVQLPTGEGFSPSGFIGPWTAGVFYRLYSVIDLEGWNQDLQAAGGPAEDALTWARMEKTTNGAFYYFKTSEEAAKAKGPSESQYGANRVWYFQTTKSQILNVADPSFLANWGDHPSFTVQISTPRSKRAYQFQLITLPKAVEAVARYFGIDVPEYDLGELYAQDIAYTDDFFAHMCGDPDEKGSWKTSALGLRRAALWEALGEPDMAKYTPGTGKYGTQAPDLIDCLQVVSNAWETQLWGRVVNIADPRVDATSDDGEKRYRIPVLFDLWGDREDLARAVATREVEEFKARQAAQGDGEQPAASAPAAPQPRAPGPPIPTPSLAVPARWAEYGTDFWTNWLSNPPPEGVAGTPAVEAARLAECDVAEINTWRKHLGLPQT